MEEHHLVVTVSPGKRDVSVKISDGIHIYFRGSLPFYKAVELIFKVRDASDNKEVSQIAREFGLETPLR